MTMSPSKAFSCRRDFQMAGHSLVFLCSLIWTQWTHKNRKLPQKDAKYCLLNINIQEPPPKNICGPSNPISFPGILFWTSYNSQTAEPTTISETKSPFSSCLFAPIETQNPLKERQRYCLMSTDNFYLCRTVVVMVLVMVMARRIWGWQWRQWYGRCDGCGDDPCATTMPLPP